MDDHEAGVRGHRRERHLLGAVAVEVVGGDGVAVVAPGQGDHDAHERVPQRQQGAKLGVDVPNNEGRDPERDRGQRAREKLRLKVGL